MLAQQIETWVKSTLASLQAEASDLVSAFETAREAARAGRPRSKLTVRVRPQRGPRATPGAFTIEWAEARFTRRGGEPKYQERYIPRGDGDQYPRRAFAGIAKPWEQLLVHDYEARFARIRQRARSVSDVRTSYRAALRALDGAVREGRADAAVP